MDPASKLTSGYLTQMTILIAVPVGVDPDVMSIEVNKSVSIAAGMYPNLKSIRTETVQDTGPKIVS